MRECIYCGRQLEKGEQCTCATSVAKRKEREAKAEAERPKTKKEIRNEERERKSREKAKAREHAQRQKEQRRQQQSHRQHQYNGAGYGGNPFGGFGQYGRPFGGVNNSSGTNPFVNIGRLLLRFLKSPIETVMNPGRMGLAEILIMVALEGIIGGLCVFAVISGAARGIFSQIGNIIGFGGENGYKLLQWWLRAAVSGLIVGYIIFFVYSGIFYVVNRYLFRQFTPYWDFVKRFVFIGLPMTVVGIVGTVLGLFSWRTFIVLIVCGLAGSVILTYELLRSMWRSVRPEKTLYTMLIAMFIFLTIIIHFVI